MRKKRLDIDWIPDALVDTSAWRTADPGWVADREAHWRRIHPRLERFGAYGPAELRALRDYFLTGRVGPVRDWQGEPRGWVPLAFRLWLHAEPSEASWAAHVKYATWGDFVESIRIVGGLGAEAEGLDGLEQRLFHVLFGEHPERAERSFLDDTKLFNGSAEWVTRRVADELQKAMPLPSAIGFVWTFQRIDRGVNGLARFTLRTMLTRNPRWSRVLPPDKASQHFVTLFDYILTGSYRAKLKKATAEQLREREELATELRDLFDEGIGPPEFQAFWQEQKALILARAASGARGGKTAKAKIASVATKKKAATKPLSETSTKAKTAPAKKVATRKAPAKKKKAPRK